MVYFYKNNRIEYELSPWDSRVLNIPTLNITSIIIEDIDSSYEIINQFIMNVSSMYKFISYRHNGNNIDLTKLLIDAGFVIVEKSYIIEKTIFNSDNLFFSQNKFQITNNLGSQDIEEIKEIAKNSFNYGRFFEDPFISNLIAKQRNLNWIDDISMSNDIKLVALEKNKKIRGFMAYKELEDHIDLLLGGVDSNFSHLAFDFWNKFLQLYCIDKTVKTVISCSNIPIINLYSKMGFIFKDVLTGFHLHIK